MQDTQHNNLRLMHASNGRGWVAWDPIQKQRREPLLEENRGTSQEVANGLSFLLPGVPGQCRAQFPQLLQSNLMPSPH